MPQPQNSVRSKKDSSNAGENTPGRKKPQPQKKRAGGAGGNGDDSDDSVDSRGNLRGFIATSDDEEEEQIRPKSKRAPPPRPTRTTRKPKVVTESSDSRPSESSDETYLTPKKKRGFQPKKQRRIKPVPVPEEEEEEEDDDDDEDEDYDEEEESEWVDEDDSEENSKTRRAEISISFGGLGQQSNDHLIPKRHNMKKESEIVNKFVKLVTEPQDDGGIDDQIDQFKSLSAEKQKQLISSLENRPSSAQENLMFKILTMNTDPRDALCSVVEV